VVGTLLAVFVLGAFALAVVVVLTLNIRQTAIPPTPTYEERLERIYQIGGDAIRW
jgi:hypothetical protein